MSFIIYQVRLGGAAAGDQLAGQLTVGLGTGVVRGVRQDRLCRDGGIGELNGALDDGVEDLVSKGVNDTGQYLF